MNFNDIREKSKGYKGAILLDKLFPYSFRKNSRSVIDIICAGFVVAAILHFIITKFGIAPASVLEVLGSSGAPLYGLLSIVIFLWLVLTLMDAFYFSLAFLSHTPSLPELPAWNKPPITFEAALILDNLGSHDLTKGFFLSPFGRKVFLRLGFSRNVCESFISKSRSLAVASECVLPGLKPGLKNDSFGAGDILEVLYDKDHDLAAFLSERGISKKDFLGAVLWVERYSALSLLKRRWWARERLGRIRGVGKDWAYGGAYLLERYAHDISDGSFNRTVFGKNPLIASAADSLERVLARDREANALFVGEEGGVRLEVIYELGARIISGSILSPLEHKRIFLFEGVSFVAATKRKEVFESELISIFNESAKAGNIIVVIPDFAEFLAEAKHLGSDPLSILESYLRSSLIQVVGIVSPDVFIGSLERNQKLMTLFEKVVVSGIDSDSVISFLEDRAADIESRQSILFTYPAIRAIAEGSDRYFSSGTLLDRASDFLSEIVPEVIKAGRHVILREDVYDLIKQKTGVPLGNIDDAEKTKLLNLEKVIGERIVGQSEAVKAIAHSMRRARSGVGNPGRPMGSFLFLGPTGVGKTETTKALAAIFFGSEERIIRLDMSEYKTEDALERLIGFAANMQEGILSSKLREQQYGVLLLDEFEKTHTKVLDLFLQILDEGYFSDMSGRRVNARNLMIIATSNAGSDLIWEMMSAKGGSASAGPAQLDKNMIVDEIVKRGIFRPELLNRFDGVVVFHPLKEDELRQIAKLMLKKLEKRLREKGIEFSASPDLIEMLVREGSDPKFGARPMNRAIQEKVEHFIATKMIQGEIIPGSRVEISAQNLE